jgi:hypothetical protein
MIQTTIEQRAAVRSKLTPTIHWRKRENLDLPRRQHLGPSAGSATIPRHPRRTEHWGHRAAGSMVRGAADGTPQGNAQGRQRVQHEGGSCDRGDPEARDNRERHRVRHVGIALLGMRRYEMREKRRYYSLAGRTVISVWNQGKGQESHRPWTIFHDGEEATFEVRELPSPIRERPDIRIGIVDLSSLVDPSRRNIPSVF